MKKFILCSLVGYVAYNFGKGVAFARAYDYFHGGCY